MLSIFLNHLLCLYTYGLCQNTWEVKRQLVVGFLDVGFGSQTQACQVWWQELSYRPHGFFS